MLSLKNGRLVDPGGGGSVLVPIGQNRFQVSGQSIEMIFETPQPSEHPKRMLKVSRSRKPEVYEAVDAVAPSWSELNEYAGKYESDEVGATYIFFVQDGKLMLERRKARNIPFTPTFADNFWNDEFGYIRFTRNRQNKVNGLLLTGGWIRRMHFSRVQHRNLIGKP